MKKKSLQGQPPVLMKDVLLDAAAAEFNQNGYFNTSVDSITKRAGVSHGAFYLYFKNKQNILAFLMGRIAETLSSIVRDKNNDAGFLNPADYPAFERDIRLIVSVMLESSGLFKTFVQGMVQNKETFDLFDGISSDIGNIFSARIKQKQITGVDSRIDALIFSQIMSILFFLSIFIFSLGIIRCDPDVLARHISIILYSVLNYDERLTKVRKKKSESRKAALLTKKKLLNVAKEEFSQHGYFDTKILDIAQKAGYSRGTFYQHFSDKDDLIQAIMLDMFYQNRDQTSVIDLMVSNLDVTSLDELIRISSIVINLFDKYSSFNWTLLQGAFYSEKLGGFYGQMFIQFSKPIQVKIKELQDDGSCQELDSLIAAEIIITTISYSIFMFFGGFIHCSREILAENLGVFLHSLLNYVNTQEK